MVDYSRFNKIAAELTDSDDEDARQNKVKVTKLDKPTTITINKQQQQQNNTISTNLDLKKRYDQWKKWSQTNDTIDDEEEREESDVEIEKEPSLQQDRKIHEILCSKPSLMNESPPKTDLPSIINKKNSSPTMNGSQNSKFLWSQTADEVYLRLKCPKETKGKDVKVDVSKHGMLCIHLRDCLFFQGKLAHSVWDDDVSTASTFAKEEEKLSKSLDWEMEDLDAKSRCINMRFTKKPPVLQQGLKLWWRTMFVPGSIGPEPLVEDEVDLTQIDGRSKEKIEQVQKVWKDAHEMFLQARAKERELAQTTEENVH